MCPSCKSKNVHHMFIPRLDAVWEDPVLCSDSLRSIADRDPDEAITFAVFTPIIQIDECLDCGAVASL